MSRRSVVKSPTLAAVEPTFVLVPFRLIRTCKRSGKRFAPTSVVLVQKLSVLPSRKVIVGMMNQLLMSFTPVVLWKLTLAYESVLAPACAGNTAGLPCPQVNVPVVVLLLMFTQPPVAVRLPTLSKPSLNGLHGPGVGVGVGDGGGVGVGVAEAQGSAPRNHPRYRQPRPRQCPVRRRLH